MIWCGHRGVAQCPFDSIRSGFLRVQSYTECMAVYGEARNLSMCTSNYEKDCITDVQ